MPSLLDSGSGMSAVRRDAIEHLTDLEWIQLPASIRVTTPVADASSHTEKWAVCLPLKFGSLIMHHWCVGYERLSVDKPLVLGIEFMGEYQTHIDFRHRTFHDEPIFVRRTGMKTLEMPTEEKLATIVSKLKEAATYPTDLEITDLFPDDERCKLYSTFGFLPTVGCCTLAASTDEVLATLSNPATDWANPVISEGPDPSVDADQVPLEFQDLLQVFKAYEGLPPDRGEFNLRINLLPGSTPPASRAYRLADVESQQLAKNLKEMLEKGHARRSHSAYAAAVLFVKKGPEGLELRMCFDYRRLNNITIRDQFPLPLIKTLLDQLAHARFFTSLDLKSGYNQVRIHPDDVHKAAFITSNGLFEPVVMPFGLCNAPALFQRMMTDYLQEEIDDGVCVVYIDDILIYGGFTEKAHIQCVRRVMSKLIKHKLTVKLSKCKFIQTEIEFLGHLVGRGYRKPMVSKTDAIQRWPLPPHVKDLRSFLGLAEFYHDLIPHFSHLAAPLHGLTTKTGSASFDWSHTAWQENEEAQNAFLALKEALTSDPLLRLIRKRGALRLTVDASEYAIGAVLEQLQKVEINVPLDTHRADAERRFYPIAYFSKTIEDSQRHWPTRTKELYALVEALKVWRHYLYGKPFEVRTDHSSLERILSQKTFVEKHASNERIMRMVEVVAAFHPHIRFLEGKKNLVADGLSRVESVPMNTMSLDMMARVLEDVPEEETETLLEFVQHALSQLTLTVPAREVVQVAGIFPSSVSHALRNRLETAWTLHDHDRLDYLIREYLMGTPTANERVLTHARRFKYEDNLLWYMDVLDDETSWVLYAPEAFRAGLMDELHSAGHYGSKSMIATLRQRWYWQGMTADINRLVERCDICKRGKSGTQKPEGKGQLIEVPAQPWTHVAMDFFSGFDESAGHNKQVLLVVCMFSKMTKLYPLKSDTTTKSLAKLLKTELVNKFLRGQQPEIFVSDRDKLFRLGWEELWSETDIRLASKDHPESDGMAERTIKSIKERLRLARDDREKRQLPRKDWEELLPLVEFQHNTAWSSSTKSSPIMIVYGTRPCFEDELVTTDDTRYLDPEQAHAARVQRYRQVQQALYDAQRINKDLVDGRRRDASLYLVGEYVFVKHDVIFDVPQLRAEDPRYLGPLKIVGVGAHNQIRVEQFLSQHDKSRVVNIDSVKPCLSDHNWPGQPPRTLAQARRRAKQDDAMFVVHREVVKNRAGEIKELFLYVNWKDCNPAMITKLRKRDFTQGRQYKELLKRSQGAFREGEIDGDGNFTENTTSQPVQPPSLPPIPTRLEEEEL